MFMPNSEFISAFGLYLFVGGSATYPCWVGMFRNNITVVQGSS